MVQYLLSRCGYTVLLYLLNAATNYTVGVTVYVVKVC